MFQMCTRRLVAAVIAFFFACTTATAEEAELETGEGLASLLMAGLDTISSHQTLINDPAIGPKGLTGEKVVAETLARFEAQTGRSALDPARTERELRLARAQLESMATVVEDYRAIIDEAGVGFKGFIPAVFGRVANERFGDRVGGEARVKITAPEAFVRNRRSRPDPWEKSVMEDRFESEEWVSGRAYSEIVEVDGRTAFRMIFPTYYDSSCLSCHGEPKGELDITGYPKEGGEEGGLGGAISITLFR